MTVMFGDLEELWLGHIEKLDELVAAARALQAELLNGT